MGPRRLPIPSERRDATREPLQPVRLLWAAHGLCSLGLALAPLAAQGDYAVNAWTLLRYPGSDIANLAPLAACVAGSLSGLAGWLRPRSRWICGVREAGVLIGTLLVALTYLQARQHILMFGGLCVAGDGNRPDASAAILPLSVLWGAWLTHAWLAAATWLKPLGS